jgi:hypothetical protein
LPADAVAGVVEVEDSREAAETFLAVEVVFRGKVAISLEVREVFREVAAVSLAVAFPPEAAVFLLVMLVSLVAEPISPVVEAGAFPGAAAVVLRSEAAAVPLDIIVLRTILHCSPMSADRARVAVECHRVQAEVNPATVVPRWEEAQHSCRPAIGRVVTSEIDPLKFPIAMKAQEHVEVMFHPNVRVGAMPAIFSAWPAGSALALLSARQPQIGPINFRRIVLAVFNSPLLLTNAQIGAGGR